MEKELSAFTFYTLEMAVRHTNGVTRCGMEAAERLIEEAGLIGGEPVRFTTTTQAGTLQDGLALSELPATECTWSVRVKVGPLGGTNYRLVLHKVRDVER